jgi:hypothetical protein
VDIAPAELFDTVTADLLATVGTMPVGDDGATVPAIDALGATRAGSSPVVDPERGLLYFGTGNEAGSLRHAQPDSSTYKIAASTARSSVRRRPPP